MSTKVAQVFANLVLLGGALALVAGVALFWNLQSLKALPPPMEEIAEEPAVASPAADEWRNCLACHRDVIGGPPRDTDSPGRSGGAAEVTENATPVPRYTPTPLPRQGHKGALPQRLAIPDVDIDGKVVPGRTSALEGGSEWEVPWEDIAWYLGTALPGSNGNTVMAGHVITRRGAGVFRNLHRVRKDTLIQVNTTEGVLTYGVTSIRTVLPTEMSAVTDTNEPTLTLITCTGDFDEATRTYSHRLVVTAKLLHD